MVTKTVYSKHFINTASSTYFRWPFSHFNQEAIKIAAKEEIILFFLPPHITHVAQPLDVIFWTT